MKERYVSRLNSHFVDGTRVTKVGKTRVTKVGKPRVTKARKFDSVTSWKEFMKERYA